MHGARASWSSRKLGVGATNSMGQACSREQPRVDWRVLCLVCFVGVRFCLSKPIENHGIDMHKLLPSSPSRMMITEAAVAMCDPAGAMLFARIMLILAKMSTIKCLLKANGGGRLSCACVSGQSIPHTYTRSRLAGAPRGGKSSAVLGSPLELKLLYSDYLS
jgi:hypothetical protein